MLPSRLSGYSEVVVKDLESRGEIGEERKGGVVLAGGGPPYHSEACCNWCHF